ncbi:hypothetical protein YPPY13_0457, partial [Yersinia pestis PY-13]
MHHTKNK